MALAANDVLHKFYWVRIPVVHGVCLDPMQCLAKSPKSSVGFRKLYRRQPQKHLLSISIYDLSPEKGLI